MKIKSITIWTFAGMILLASMVKVNHEIATNPPRIKMYSALFTKMLKSMSLSLQKYLHLAYYINERLLMLSCCKAFYVYNWIC